MNNNVGKISDIVSEEDLDAIAKQAATLITKMSEPEPEAQERGFTKTELVKAMYVYNLQHRMTPEDFKFSEDLLTDTRNQIDYLISLIN
jgi:hypothetical protein